MEPAALRALAYDFGAKRIGAAFGQDLSGSACELPPLAARGGTPDWEALEKQLQEWRPVLLLVGLPLHIDGQESATSERARRFARQLFERFGIPCEMVDERLSSVEAQDALRQRRGGKHSTDSAAARIVLEEWLQAHSLQRKTMEGRLQELRRRIDAAAARPQAPAAEGAPAADGELAVDGAATDGTPAADRVKAADGAAANIRLVGVSKGQSAAAMHNAHRLGVCDFGENYLGEALRKMGALRGLTHTRHFLGVVQSNKTAAIAEHFDWVHSLARLRIAERLNAQRPAEKPPLQVCLQINFHNEPQKEGLRTPAELCALAEQVADLPRLQLRGVMALPPAETDPASQCQACADVAGAFYDLQRRLPQLDTLSLGSSVDFESAIAAGANLVRIGAALFGPRKGANPP